MGEFSQPDNSEIEGLDTSRESASMERILEMAFLSDLIQEAWFGRHKLVDVLHSTVDAFGHDVVLECGNVIRHVQIKSRALGGKNTRYNVNMRLAERPSGCVIWIGWERIENRVQMTYRWFGGAPGEPLPDLGKVVAKHSKGTATGEKLPRSGIRVVTLGRFERLVSVSDVLTRLFGPD